MDAGGGAQCLHVGANESSSRRAAWRHIVLVNAWNEWGEQAVLEPSEEDGPAFLEATTKALVAVEGNLRHIPRQPYHAGRAGRAARGEVY